MITTDAPAKNDTVLFKLEGTYGVNSYGEEYVTDKDGNTVYLTKAQKKAVSVLKRYTPEPSGIGTVIRVGSVIYTKWDDGKWHTLATSSNSYVGGYTWAELTDCYVPDAFKVLTGKTPGAPLGFKPNDLKGTSGYGKWVAYKTTTGATREFRVTVYGLEDQSGHVLPFDQSRQFALDILAAIG